MPNVLFLPLPSRRALSSTFTARFVFPSSLRSNRGVPVPSISNRSSSPSSSTSETAIADERLRPLKQLIVDECRRVAARDGVDLAADFVDRIDRQYAPSNNLSSMQQDLLKGRRTEIDFLNGAVVKLGAQYGVECPVNQALTMIIKAMEPASPS